MCGVEVLVFCALKCEAAGGHESVPKFGKEVSQSCISCVTICQTFVWKNPCVLRRSLQDISKSG